jgi:hypothetical protein
MNSNNVKLCIAAAIGAVVVIKDGVRVRREEQLKRQKIQRDLLLDLEAIDNAQIMMHKRIDRGDFHSIEELTRGLQDEIKFSMIAIREDN